MVNSLLLLASIWAMLIPTKHALHMFQQNRYELKRYTQWMKNWRPDMLIVPIIATCISFFLPKNIQWIFLCIVLIGMGCYLYLEEKKKNYIKPLVLTNRVKRQVGVLEILALLVIYILFHFQLYFVLPILSVLLSWLLIYPMGCITAPIEAYFRNQFKKKAKDILNSHTGLIKIGITGSFGKTTTKNIVQAVISEKYNSLMTPASYNTPMGITRTIREMLKPIHQVFICEMGADHVGDIVELMDFVEPTIGIVTSIGPQHLNTFGSQENITNEKMQIIEKLPSDGIGIMNVDNPFIREYDVKNTCQLLTYGIHEESADYRAINITYSPTGSKFEIVHHDEIIPVETKLLGELNVLNILSAVTTARALDIDWNTIEKALKTMPQVEHRLESKRINGYRFIDDAFNSNPTGSSGALDVLAMMPNQRFIVTPGMIDLGEKQDELNRAFGQKMKDKADIVILVGKSQTEPIYEGLKDSGFNMDNVYVLDTVKEAFALVYQLATPEDTILLENDLPDAFNH